MKCYNSNFDKSLHIFVVCFFVFVNCLKANDIDDRILHRVRRKVTQKDVNFWPNGEIPYIIEPRVYNSYNLRNAIEDSIRIVEKETCIKFTRLNQNFIDSSSFGDEHRYVHFVYGDGCSSSVGMADGTGPQELTVDRNCGHLPMVLHELGHLLGFWHEQARPDRDAHVRVNWGNIIERFAYNFNRRDDARLWAPYDLSSAMHYDLATYSENGERTLQPFEIGLSYLVGKRSSFSFYDLLTIHRMYACADKCPPIKCENGGFLDKNCNCVCPRQLKGKLCDKIETDKDCGGVFDVDSGLTVTTPNYPETYDNSKHCAWLFKSPPGTLMEFEVHDFKTGKTDSGFCLDVVEFRRIDIGIERGEEHCGEYSHQSRNTTTNYAILNFISDRRHNANDRGFNITIHVHEKPGCSSRPCVNGGKCRFVEDIDDYMCTCAPNYIGKNCELEVVNGGFSDWSDWSVCTASCGLQYRGRTCTNPMPQNGGLDCRGRIEQLQYCTSNIYDCNDKLACDFGIDYQPDDCSIATEGVSDLEWTLTHAQTKTAKTGPTFGHTLGTEGDYYIYIEGSYGLHKEPTTFWLPSRFWNPSFYCLQFFYHMHGKDTGTLQVLRRIDSESEPFVHWQYSGEQGIDWIEADVDVILFNDISVGFRGIKGDGIYSDIAIDDISISPGQCSVKNVHVCELNGQNYRSGMHFEYNDGCVVKRCFCNRDGYVDCPVWDLDNSGCLSRLKQNSGRRRKTAKQRRLIKQRQRLRQQKKKREERKLAAAAKKRKASKKDLPDD